MRPRIIDCRGLVFAGWPVPVLGTGVYSLMRVITRRALRDFWESRSPYADAEGPLRSWYADARRATWQKPADVKARYANASILQGRRVVFNMGGNKYRLVVQINYAYQIIYVRFVGTHAQYDRIDAQTV